MFKLINCTPDIPVNAVMNILVVYREVNTTAQV